MTKFMLGKFQTDKAVCVCSTLKELPVNISNIYVFFFVVVVTLSYNMVWHGTESAIIFNAMHNLTM